MVPPATGVTSDLWSGLNPTNAGALPAERDSTDWNGFFRPDWRFPFFESLDIEGGYIFVAYTTGFQIWDASGANAAQPQKLSERDGWRGEWLVWPSGNSEIRDFPFDVDAPAGNTNVVATAGEAEVGLGIWNTVDKVHPKGIYHDVGRGYGEVYSAVIGGRSYAFGAAEVGTSTGVEVYDMTAALSLPPTGCVQTLGSGNCTGIYVGRIGADEGVSYVDGVALSNGKHLLAYSSGVPIKGVALWDVTNPVAASNLRSGGGRFLNTDIIYGVALWQQGASTYLGVNAGTSGRIYNVTNCLDGSCTSLPGPIWTKSWSVPAARFFVTFSRGGTGGNTPYLYFGETNGCGSPGQHREWLFDVSNPASPVEEGYNPAKTKTVTDASGTPYTVDYWSYYSSYPTGFQLVVPRRGKFNGSYFYRAAYTIFDVHQKVNLSPAITVTGPATAYQNENAVFTAVASNCTPLSTGWTWTTGSGGTIVGSSTGSSITVNWNALGAKTVTAMNSGGCSAAQGSADVTILDPAPAVGSVTASPSTAPQCTPITFTANGVTGKPTLSYSWAVNPAAGGCGATPTLSSGTRRAVPPLGSATVYQGQVTVSNGSGSAIKSASVTLTPLAGLPSAGAFTPTNDAFVAATVQFHVNASGATDWNWDFGRGYTGYTNDPTSGPNPVHTYSQADVNAVCPGGVPCLFEVKVKVKNCIASEVESLILPVTITQIAPLAITTFSAQGCAFGFCTFDVNHAITFVETVTGDPDFYDYDWDGSGGGNCANDAAFEASGFTTPQTSHAYTSTGTFTPVFRIRRGGTEKTCFTHLTPLLIQNPQPASIFVSGPTTGSINTSYDFTASAQNCTPSANGWTWTTGGGSGSSSTNSISISWSSAGTKSVTAKNSACGTVTGSKSITLSGGGSGGVTANFSFSPTNPTAGQTVNFNGSSSTGTIAAYDWTFGDGGSGSGVTASHTYATAGTFTVTLSVLGPGCASPSCSASVSKTVTVGGSSSSVVASFTYTPANPEAGQPVSFDGRSSTGNVALYGWDFGDGGGGGGGASVATGATVDHTFAAAGSYQVTLSALPAGCTSPACTSSNTKTVVVSPAALGCTPSANTACLLNGRFKAAVHFHDQRSGRSGVGQVLPFPNTGQSAAFWFFRNTNPELLVKMVDGSTLPQNPAFWVFYGSLTDVEFWLDVTDTHGDADSTNDVTSHYHNLPGTICGQLDTGAFPQGSPLIGGGGATVVDLLRTGFEAPDAGAAIAGASGTCTPTGANLCLLGGRFSVEVSFHDQRSDQTGEGTAVPGTDQSGYFWFFNSNNLELVIKMVNGTVTGGNGHFWVFWGGTTDVEYTLRVTDTATGATWETTNPAGNICGGANTAAFPGP